MQEKTVILKEAKTDTKQVRVRVVKAPIVDTAELRRIIFARARALVL